MSVTPIHEFPGDSLVSEAAYDDLMAGFYIPLWQTVERQAIATFDVDLDGRSQERILRLVAGCQQLDDVLDETPDKAAGRQLYDRVVDYAVGRPLEIAAAPCIAAISLVDRPPTGALPELQTSAVLMRNALADLPRTQKTAIKESAGAIADIAALKRAETNAAEYAKLASLEGRLTGFLLSQGFEPETLDDDATKQYVAWMSGVLALATVADHAKDLMPDYETGQTTVFPTAKNRLTIASAAIPIMASMSASPDSYRASVRFVRDLRERDKLRAASRN